MTGKSGRKSAAESASNERRWQQSILPCACEHAQQDRIYGKGMRAHNFAYKKKVWRCTVCGKEKAA